MALYLHGLFPDRTVVTFHYRGYAASSGRPSAEALLSDSLLIFDQLQQAHARERVIAVGFSIGSGVAAYLARHRPAAGLILVTPLAPRQAQDHRRSVPVLNVGGLGLQNEGASILSTMTCRLRPLTFLPAS